MNQSELKREWTFSFDNPMIRFYLWLWEADEDEVTFCKLVWGLVLAPLGLLIRGLWMLAWPLRWLTVRTFYRLGEMDRKAKEARKAELKKEKLPGRAAELFARPWPRRIGGVLGWAFVVSLGLFTLAALGWGLFMFVTVWLPDGVYWFFHSDAWTVVPFVFGLIALWALTFISVTKLLKWRQRRRKQKHEAGEPTVGDVLVGGFRAVKSNTCPRIKLR